MKEIDEFVKYSNLFNIYRELFSDKQKQYLDAFLNEDNSFAEIAEAMNISRQAVFDNIRNACKKLDSYEEKLNIYKKNQNYLTKLRKISIDIKDNRIDEIIKEIEGI